MRNRCYPNKTRLGEELRCRWPFVAAAGRSRAIRPGTQKINVAGGRPPFSQDFAKRTQAHSKGFRRKTNPDRSEYLHTTFELVLSNQRLELDNAAANRDRNRLRTVACAQFFHDVLDVNLYGLFGDEKPVRDVAIPVASGDMTQHVDLTHR